MAEIDRLYPWDQGRITQKADYDHRSPSRAEASKEKSTTPDRGQSGAYKRSDESIEEELKERIALSPRIDPRGLAIEVRQGVVTLRGLVPVEKMVQSAEEIAREVTGVNEVRNELHVSFASHISP